jgi:hypothetical protein
MMTASITSVITPAVTRDLVVLDDVREQLQIRPNDTAQDVWLAKVISRVSRLAEQYCNRVFAQQGYQDIFGAVGGLQGQPLILAQAPVGITSVTVDGTSLSGATDYIVDIDAGLVYRAADPFLWQSTTSIYVAYTGGFALIPDDVQMAVIELCVMEFRGRTRDPMLRERETPGLGRETYWVGPVPGQTLPGDLGPTLDPYRRGGIG